MQLALGISVLLLVCVLLPQQRVVVAADADAAAALLSAMKDPDGMLGTAGAYARLMSHRHSLSQGHLERSLAYKGSNFRLRRVLEQLLSTKQQHLHVGVIGGSISWGHGVQKGTQDWFALVQRWMQETFPQHNVTFKNGCVPATQSNYVSSCLQQFVDADVDLLFIEYVTNDGYHHGSVDNSLVRAYERLLRKLLSFRRAPAVVLMEFFATDIKTTNLPFYATGEDQYGVLAQYYSTPWLSYRDAVWHDYMAEAQGFRRFQIFPVQEERHPTPLGHRYMADIAIHLLQQTYLDSLLYPADLTQLAKHPAIKVPDPMFAGNWESSNLLCVIGEQLPHAVVDNKGFEWINEGTAVKPKWGFVALQVGSTLTLKVDTRAHAEQNASRSASSSSAGSTAPATSLADAAPGQDGAARDMIVWVGYVKSWRQMGSASLACIKGCECQNTTVDALHDAQNTQQHMVKMHATQAPECVVEVRVNPWSRSKEHKFKVTAVMVTHAVEFSGHGDWSDSVLLDNISPNQGP